jgi:hypothetical protein
MLVVLIIENGHYFYGNRELCDTADGDLVERDIRKLSDRRCDPAVVYAVSVCGDLGIGWGASTVSGEMVA